MTGDTTLAEWNQHYDPLPGGVYTAQPFEYDETCTAIDFEPGDQLVFRYTGANGASMESYIPDGDGSFENGRIPNITLPR
jgi:hypothetical protein